ncbi:hypothetical protein KBD71_00810 [Candidatus Woesebacteria bacterium]|nr:hypothetical protein [Candidatus Woesebacteria bacterium]
MKKTKKEAPSALYSEQPSIFAVSYKEIAKRHFFAGFMAGLGGITATLVMGFLLSVLITQLIAPRLSTILTVTRTTLEEAGFFPQPRTSPPQQ